MSQNKEIWVNPLGGLGDTLMLSGVLKLVYDANPTQKFKLIRRTKYLSILKGHPAIKFVGFPPTDAHIIRTDYWADEKFNPCSSRAFQILAHAFGLPTPVKEVLYLPGEIELDPLLDETIPWREKNILIAPFSESPRKVMSPQRWHHLVEMLLRDNLFVIQAGRLGDMHIKNAYSVLGLTSVRQLVALIKKCDLVITSDSFVMHAAQLVNTPAVVLWGPTNSSVYGYKDQQHIRSDIKCSIVDQCIGPGQSLNYSMPCALKDEFFCMNISVEDIYDAVNKFI